VELHNIGIGEAKPIKRREENVVEGEAEITLFKDAQRIIDACRGYSHLVVVISPIDTKAAMMQVVKVIDFGEKVINVKMDLKDRADVLHIQPYDVFKDCVFSASSPRDLLSLPRDEALKAMLKAGESFHGELCAGVAVGVRMLYRASVELGCEPRSRELKALVAVKACVADGIQAAMGATNKRFRALEHIDGTATFTYGNKAVKIKLSESPRFRTAEEVFVAEDKDVISEVEKFSLLSSEPSS